MIFHVSLMKLSILLLIYFKFDEIKKGKYTGKTLNVFAFRVHAHAHGDVNSGKI